ncbi:Bor protein [Ekhidna lutea]|uniref:Bor protein n=1 Tax=Ekhidna lutea TaxID=447679 RepID=A0A239KS38_EKHLU|nr:Bor family protein [Ekhidna lutea]SNT20339.1 Bor protein [Ekhidna lutea]
MKKTIKVLSIAIVMGLCLSSCYTYTTVVGNGAQGNQQISSWNHYVIYGLAPVGVSDPQNLAGDAKDYDVTTKISFVNGLVAALTFSIYTPTTTIVTK